MSDLKNLQRRTSTPIPLGSRIIRKIKARTTVNGVTVTILPDREGKVEKGSAHTNFNVSTTQPRISRNGVVTPPKIYLRIRTTYKKGVDKSAPSAYGRGTTIEDKRNNNTSLKFHEGMHGQDYLDFLRNNRPPIFGGGKRNMTEQEFYEAFEKYKAEFTDYFNKMRKYTERHTDCVGTVTIDQVNGTKICEF